jgi:DNA-binding response OmpR family regulator/two-component sensor histidine kinase
MAAFDSLKTGRTSVKYMGIIENNIKRLHELVNELLDFRALQNGKMRLNRVPANWNRILEECCADFFEYASHRNINFINQFDETIPDKLLFDTKVVEKIVLNLLNNAFKYVSTGGKITVRTLSDISHFHSPHPYSLVQQFASSDSGEPSATTEIALVVSDNGVGISQASIAKVFERYYRVDDTSDEQHIGSGIGLALVKSLVELHGGSISIYSERNKGTDFVISFRLPLTEDSGTHPATVSLPNGDTSGFIRYKENIVEETPDMVTFDVIDESTYPVYNEKKTILLVEDNEDLRVLIAEILDKDYHVIQAANGADALEKLRDENPDLIITDVIMPRVGGIELCHSVKHNIETSHSPVVRLTAKSGMENQLEGMESGADLYLEKPVNRKLLLIGIANIFIHQERIRTYYSKNFFSDNSYAKFNKRDSEFMVALQNEIEKQIADSELDVEKLAASLAISRSKLYTKIKTLTDKSIVEYIRSYRLRKIARMLLEEDLPINLIIEQAGIDNPSYFSRIFKKEFGVTPTEFMEKNRKGN